MTRQEAFDKVCVHLKKQRRRAVDSRGLCQFQNIAGDMCALGGLARREDNLGYTLRLGWSERIGLPFVGNSDFFQSLRHAHDNALDNKFKARLKAVAERFGLEWKHG